MSKIFLSHPKESLILGIIFLISFGCTKTNKTEMLVMGGTILTIDSSMPEVETMMIRDGRIEAVGSRAELETRFPKARRHDLNGRIVLPGFIDSHTHVYALAHDMRKADLIGMNLMAKEGVTSIHEAGMGQIMVQAFSELREEGRLPLRVYGMLSRRDEDLMEEWLKRGPLVDPNAFFTVRSIKVFYDGSALYPVCNPAMP